MASARPYVGCKIWLISKAQNRYEGILYTIDKSNSTVVLANVKCFGTERRPTDRPTPPKDDIYEYIIFKGSDIKDIMLCETPRHNLPPDPAIVQVSGGSSSGPHTLSPAGISAYNQLANALLRQQYATALGLVPGLHVQKGPMVEKAVQTAQMESALQRRAPTGAQGQHLDRRRPRRTREEKMGAGPAVRSNPGVATSQQDTWQQSPERKPPPRRRQGARRRRNRGQGQLRVANASFPILKFETDFDFASSNAQFMEEELERELQNGMFLKEGKYELEVKDKEELHPTAEESHFGPKCYYNKAKSFFDNISSGNIFRITWAEERKRNLETFGVPGRFLRGQNFRGGYSGSGIVRTGQL